MRGGARPAPVLLLALAIGAVGCVQRLAPPEPEDETADALREAHAEEALDLVLRRAKRVLTIGNAIRTRGWDLCGEEVAPLLGLDSYHISNDEKPFAQALIRRHGVREDDTVVLVADPDAPAARAGIAAGDVLLEVNGRKIKWFRQVSRELARSPETPPRIEVRRGVDRHQLVLGRVPACRYVVTLVMHDGLSTGPVHSVDYRRHGYVANGLLRFVESDDELAVFIPHELAHRIFGGMDGSYPDQEHEADRLGLYLTAQAGFDLSVAPSAWERLALELPLLIEYERTTYVRSEPRHARIARRLPAIRATVAEIEAKRAAGEPLAP